MNNKVLVVAVHPDDETLGCGGALQRHKDSGDEIHWLICTSIKEEDGFSLEKIKQRNDEINTVSNMYDFDSVNSLELSTMKVDQYGVKIIVDSISDILIKIQPNIIYLPFKGDVHSDHKAISSAVYSCTKSFRHPYIKKIYMMETLSETEFSLSLSGDSFIPNVFVDITNYMDKKIDILKVYEGEVGQHPFPRSEDNVRALATCRGATSGCVYAESFMLIKEII